MYECKFCNREFKSKIGVSLHKNKSHNDIVQREIIESQIKESTYHYKCECDKKFKTEQSLVGHKSHCKDYLTSRSQYLSFLTKEILYEYLIIKNLSANYIATTIFADKNIHAKSIIQYAKISGIPTKSVKDSCNTSHVKNAKCETNLKRYGGVNPLSKNTEPYKKRNATVKKKYGVDNVFQLEDVKQKSINTMIEKFGVSSNAYRTDINRNHSGKRSKPHRKVEDLLLKLKIQFESEAFANGLHTFNHALQRKYNPRLDILLADKKQIIEIYGDRWHCNPAVGWKATDGKYCYYGWKTAEETWKSNKIRENHITSNGYKLLILWEHDINKRIDWVEEQILNFIK